MIGSLAANADGRLMTGVLGALAVLLVLALRKYPTAGFCVWALTLCFVPIWVGAGGRVFLPALVLLSAAAVVAWARKPVPRISVVDVVILGFAILYCVAFLLDLGRISDGLTLFAYWILAYAVGRLAPARIPVSVLYRILVIAFVAVTVLALAEFISGQNIFVRVFRFSNAQYELWGVIQSRGGALRVEGAFGHSIALGACLALAVPLAMVVKLPLRVRLLVVAGLLGATAVTFSRIGIISAVTSLLLTAVFLPSMLTSQQRLAFLALLGVAAAAAFPLLTGTFLEAGQEAAGSAAYRSDLLSLVPQMRLLGVADVFQVLPDGTAYFGSFRSIDSALILLGLSYGLIPLFAVAGLLVGAVVLVLRRKATPPTIALVAQLPGLATVALITQYSCFLWFMCGLAVSTQVIQKQRQQAKIPEVEMPPLGGTRVNPVKQGVSIAER
jgi:hypothetical protein